MTLPRYINDLLYRYDCVIVPDFGGFVTNTVSAKVNHFSHTFYPPTKQITFNAHIKNNDGLLANYIASSENISFDKASEKISEVVKKWNTLLKKEAILIGNVGSISLNNKGQLIFEPNTASNYLTETFGMGALSSPAVKRLAYKQDTANLTPIVTKKSSGFLKYAASIAVLFALGIIGWKGYQNNHLEEQYSKQQAKIEKKIQAATFVIGDPLPTIQLNIKKQIPKSFHIVAGAFEFHNNAIKKLAQLKTKGFDAQIIGKNKWGLTQVSYASFKTRAEAYKNLEKIRNSYSEDAWLLVKKKQ